jgi:putative flippase GtrA
LGLSIPYGSSVFAVAKKKNPIDSNTAFPAAFINTNLLFKIKTYLKSGVLLDQFFKYSIVGILNTALGLTVIFLLYNVLHVNYLLSNIGGYFVGLINSFLWNRNWTFNSQKHFSKEVLPFLMVFGFSFVLNFLVVLLSVEVFKIRPNFAQIMGIAVYSITNFMINKNWTFSK